jgi:hypothetical protein
MTTQVQIPNSKTNAFIEAATNCFPEMNPQVSEEGDFWTTIEFETASGTDEEKINDLLDSFLADNAS